MGREIELKKKTKKEVK